MTSARHGSRRKLATVRPQCLSPPAPPRREHPLGVRRNATDAKSIYGAMKTIHAGLTILVMFVVAQPARAIDLDAYADLLDRHTYQVEHTARTHVDYEALRNSAEWEGLVHSLTRSRPDQLNTREEQLAFWINAYNILAIDLVRRNYPVDSIRDIGSFFVPVWDREAGQIGDRSYTLGEIEHEILRPLGRPADPRGDRPAPRPLAPGCAASLTNHRGLTDSSMTPSAGFYRTPRRGSASSRTRIPSD